MGLSGLATSETTSGLPITSHKKLNILEVATFLAQIFPPTNMQEMFISVQFGDYKCSSTAASTVCISRFLLSFCFCMHFSLMDLDWSLLTLIKQVGGNNETICALKDVDGGQSLPPVGD